MKHIVRSAFLIFAFCAATAHADLRRSINDRDIHPEDAFLIDAQCSAVFQILVDIGNQRGAEAVTEWTKRASFMAAQAINGHGIQFQSTLDIATPLIEDTVVREHAAYTNGLQSTDPATAEHEAARFLNDVKFCNLRMLALAAILEG